MTTASDQISGTQQPVKVGLIEEDLIILRALEDTRKCIIANIVLMMGDLPKKYQPKFLSTLDVAIEIVQKRTEAALALAGGAK